MGCVCNKSNNPEETVCIEPNAPYEPSPDDTMVTFIVIGLRIG